MSDAGELNRRLIYHCRVFDVYESDVRLPDGRIFKANWIDHRPCIAVVPVNPEGRLILIRQYRQAAGGMIVEIPAGNMDRTGEAVEACVQRELAEEIGFQAGRLIQLFEGYLVPGYCNEYMYFYLALDLQPASLPGDEDEYIRVMTASFAEAREMIRDKKIIDAKTALGIQMAREYLEENGQRGR
ncbi:MAG: NUDIX hydrolase [Deltaproteobacteria bacterium]|nr:NUDIX hydrolase [Deltaproteobacteria bacterium]